jgi:hypothetical protein
MDNIISENGSSGDLFGKMPFRRRDPVPRAKPPPELVAARVLCRQLSRKQAPREKQRIAHLICLNLLSMLRHGS